MNVEMRGINKSFGTNQVLKDVSLTLPETGFVCILGQREGHPIKPDPGIVIEAISACEGTKPEETVYCGDSDVDMQTGMNAGVNTIGVTWGFRTRDELATYSPHLLADSPEEICNFIASL